MGAPSQPLVSVVVPHIAASSAAAAIASLQAQTLDRWEAILVASASSAQPPTCTDPRCRRVETASADWAGLCLAGLSAASGDFVSILHPHDALLPGALEALVDAAKTAQTDAALCSYSFSSPLGPLPGDPLAGLARQALGLAEWSRCKLAPTHAMIVRRTTAAAVPLSGTPLTGGDHDWCIGLAHRGTRWAVVPRRLATVALADPLPAPAIEQAIAAHARVIADACRRAPDPADLPTVLRSHVEAVTLLRAFMHDVAAAGAGPDADSALAGLVHPGNLFAQWWQRLRFFGLPPRHALEAAGGGDLRALATPARIARWLTSQASPPRPTVLLGLGRNARHVAAALAARAVPILARDDALRQPPPWAAGDGLHIRLLAPGDPWDRDATYLMTPTDDAAFLARLPAGLHVLRWSAAAEAVARDLASSTLSDMIGRDTAPPIDPARCEPRLALAGPEPAANDSRPR